MKYILSLLSSLFIFLSSNAQSVTDSNGLHGIVSGMHIENNVSYVLVKYDFDAIGVYAVSRLEMNATTIVTEGCLQVKGIARKAFHWTDMIFYIRKKEFNHYKTNSNEKTTHGSDCNSNSK